MTNSYELNPIPRKELRYGSLDGLRAYSSIGIILMHVLANGAYDLSGFVFVKLIPSFTDLVFLFMVISGFSLCCGYYEKIVNGQISLSQFYSKRFARVWPFFALLCALDFVISPSVSSLYEVLANLTLCFGLIPNAHISVIGVGWFLGLVFVFYFLFPFFCYLLSDKRRAWLSCGMALLLNLLCTLHFGVGRTSIAYSAVFFLAGGMIYLYREPLRRFADKFGWLVLIGIVAVLAVYYVFSKAFVVMLSITTLITIYALRSRHRSVTILCNPVVKKLGGISMEIYLSHMVIYRVLEKVGAAHLVSSDLLSYVIAAIGTIVGTVIFATASKKLLSLLIQRVKRKK